MIRNDSTFICLFKTLLLDKATGQLLKLFLTELLGFNFDFALPLHNRYDGQFVWRFLISMQRLWPYWNWDVSKCLMYVLYIVVWRCCLLPGCLKGTILSFIQVSAWWDHWSNVRQILVKHSKSTPYAPTLVKRKENSLDLCCIYLD